MPSTMTCVCHGLLPCDRAPSLRAATILSQEVKELIVKMLHVMGKPSMHVMIIRNTQDGSWQLWPGETTAGKPLITFTPSTAKTYKGATMSD